MTIYLIRHGRTEANDRSLYCGSTDVSLSEAGREELRGIHHDIPHVRFLTSGMKRANETLRILFGDVPYDTDFRFREMDFGVFEMHSHEELKDDPAYQAWRGGDSNVSVPPGGESKGQMRARAVEAFASLREDTCVVTHGGVIAGIMSHLFPAEGRNHKQWQPTNGHGYCITKHGFREI